MTAKGVRVGKDQPIRTGTAQHARQRIVGQQAGIDCDAATGADFDLVATAGLPRWVFDSGILYNRMRRLKAAQDSDCDTREKWPDAEVLGDGVSISGGFFRCSRVLMYVPESRAFKRRLD